MKLIFTLTAGRTGTMYLAELLRANLPDTEVHHEILEYDSFGVDTPEISQRPNTSICPTYNSRSSTSVSSMTERASSGC